MREAGIDTVHVSEIGYSTADDAAILQRGREEERIVITFDADFHALLALSRAITPSVIRIRIEGLYGKKTADLIQAEQEELTVITNSAGFLMTWGNCQTTTKHRSCPLWLPVILQIQEQKGYLDERA